MPPVCGRVPRRERKVPEFSAPASGGGGWARDGARAGTARPGGGGRTRRGSAGNGHAHARATHRLRFGIPRQTRARTSRMDEAVASPCPPGPVGGGEVLGPARPLRALPLGAFSSGRSAPSSSGVPVLPGGRYVLTQIRGSSNRIDGQGPWPWGSECDGKRPVIRRERSLVSFERAPEGEAGA